MTFYWLEPGWKSATCPHCGVNIWNSGGDPDWGECYECKAARSQQQQMEQPGPVCDICGINDAVSATNGFYVCSKECSGEALERGEK